MPGPQKLYSAQIHIHCEPELKQAIEVKAKREGISTNEAIRRAIRKVLGRCRD